MFLDLNPEEIVESYIDFLQQEENARPRRGCFIDDSLAREVQERLSREAHLWDKEVVWALRQSENMGQIKLCVTERDPIGSTMIAFDIPGTHGPHLMYAKNFHFSQNPYLEENRRKEIEVHGSPLEEDVYRYHFYDSNGDEFLRSFNASGLEVGLPRLKTKWAFVECPSMIMDPTALLEVHTTLSKAYNLVVFQAYHPEDIKIREREMKKAHEFATVWGLPQLKDPSELKPAKESEFREYNSTLILKEYSSFL